MYMMKRELSIVNKRYDKMKIELERSMQKETELLKFKVSSTKSTDLVPVVRKVDSAIHQIVIFSTVVMCNYMQKFTPLSAQITAFANGILVWFY